MKNLHYTIGSEDKGAFKEYEIEFVGLKLGVYTFHYLIKDAFFTHFSESPIQKSDVQINLTFTKKHNFFLLNFEIIGSIHAECDRCLEAFDFPLSGNYEIIIKFDGLVQQDQQGDGEIMFLSPGAISINVAQLIYEFIVLSLPIKKTHPVDEEGFSTCNPEVLAILEDGFGTTDDYDDAEETIDPRWAALKNLKNGEEK